MSDVLGMIWESLYTAVGLFWRAAWALALGYAISAAIQVFISRRAAAQKLGKGTPGQLSLAALLGFISSSCSLAALSATRSLWTNLASGHPGADQDGPSSLGLIESTVGGRNFAVRHQD